VSAWNRASVANVASPANSCSAATAASEKRAAASAGNCSATAAPARLPGGPSACARRNAKLQSTAALRGGAEAPAPLEAAGADGALQRCCSTRSPSRSDSSSTSPLAG
jgi:hypothetical protein